MDSLSKAIKIAGSQRQLAEKVGGVQTRISEWRRRGEVPPDAVIGVSRAVDFQVTPHELRPDLYPHPEDGLPESMRKKEAA